MTYPHDNLVRDWLDGHAVQYLEEGVWLDMPPPATAHKVPSMYRDRQYRRKPVNARYRLAVTNRPDLKMAMVQSLQQAELLERSPQFGRWFGDWVEVVIE